MIEVLACYEAYIRELEKEKDNELRREKDLEFRKDRKKREAYLVIPPQTAHSHYGA
jgi:hypothetical protein